MYCTISYCDYYAFIVLSRKCTVLLYWYWYMYCSTVCTVHKEWRRWMAGSWQPQEAGVNCNLYCTGTDWGKKESGKKKGRERSRRNLGGKQHYTSSTTVTRAHKSIHLQPTYNTTNDVFPTARLSNSTRYPNDSHNKRKQWLKVWSRRRRRRPTPRSASLAASFPFFPTPPSLWDVGRSRKRRAPNLQCKRTNRWPEGGQFDEEQSKARRASARHTHHQAQKGSTSQAEQSEKGKFFFVFLESRRGEGRRKAKNMELTRSAETLCWPHRTHGKKLGWEGGTFGDAQGWQEG